MIGVDYLLDTNIAVAYLNNDLAVRQRLAPLRYYMSSTAPGELYFGAYNSQRIVANKQQIERFQAINTVLIVDAQTSDIYGLLKWQLKQKGRPIPENDIWIAATAIQHKLTLISRDAHFQHVDQLRWEQWSTQ